MSVNTDIKQIASLRGVKTSGCMTCIDGELHKQLVSIAYEKGLSLNNLIVSMLEQSYEWPDTELLLPLLCDQLEQLYKLKPVCKDITHTLEARPRNEKEDVEAIKEETSTKAVKKESSIRGKKESSIRGKKAKRHQATKNGQFNAAVDGRSNDDNIRLEDGPSAPQGGKRRRKEAKQVDESSDMREDRGQPKPKKRRRAIG